MQTNRCQGGMKIMKTRNGSNWYIQDLNNYTKEFLIEIIEDLTQD